MKLAVVKSLLLIFAAAGITSNVEADSKTIFPLHDYSLHHSEIETSVQERYLRVNGANSCSTTDRAVEISPVYLPEFKTKRPTHWHYGWPIAAKIKNTTSVLFRIGVSHPEDRDYGFPVSQAMDCPKCKDMDNDGWVTPKECNLSGEQHHTSMFAIYSDDDGDSWKVSGNIAGKKIEFLCGRDITPNQRLECLRQKSLFQPRLSPQYEAAGLARNANGRAIGVHDDTMYALNYLGLFKSGDGKNWTSVESRPLQGDGRNFYPGPNILFVGDSIVVFGGTDCSQPKIPIENPDCTEPRLQEDDYRLSAIRSKDKGKTWEHIVFSNTFEDNSYKFTEPAALHLRMFGKILLLVRDQDSYKCATNNRKGFFQIVFPEDFSIKSKFNLKRTNILMSCHDTADLIHNHTNNRIEAVVTNRMGKGLRHEASQIGGVTYDHQSLNIFSKPATGEALWLEDWRHDSVLAYQESGVIDGLHPGASVVQRGTPGHQDLYVYSGGNNACSGAGIFRVRRSLSTKHVSEFCGGKNGEYSNGKNMISIFPLATMESPTHPQSIIIGLKHANYSNASTDGELIFYRMDGQGYKPYKIIRIKRLTAKRIIRAYRNSQLIVGKYIDSTEWQIAFPINDSGLLALKALNFSSDQDLYQEITFPLGDTIPYHPDSRVYSGNFDGSNDEYSDLLVHSPSLKSKKTRMFLRSEAGRYREVSSVTFTYKKFLPYIIADLNGNDFDEVLRCRHLGTGAPTTNCAILEYDKISSTFQFVDDITLKGVHLGKTDVGYFLHPKRTRKQSVIFSSDDHDDSCGIWELTMVNDKPIVGCLSKYSTMNGIFAVKNTGQHDWIGRISEKRGAVERLIRDSVSKEHVQDGNLMWRFGR